MSEDVPDVLGWERRQRGIFEGKEWGTALGAAKLDAKAWDQRFSFAVENISVQPLQNSWPFLDHEHRLTQVSLPNELIGWVYFRIERDDQNCTLLWVEVKRFHRVG